MKIKVSEATGKTLDWAVAKAEGYQAVHHQAPTANLFRPREAVVHTSELNYSTYWSQGGPIMDREGISVIRCDDTNIPDSEGFWQSIYKPCWAAVIGKRHAKSENHGSQGDYWGLSYHVDENAMLGPTPLIAAMRCFVASRLGDEVEVPEELV